MSPPSATLTARVERSAVAATSTATLYACAEVTGATGSSDSGRNPVHVAVVLDKSGSMSGEKLDRAKETLQFLTKELQSTDMLSLVLYDTEVTTVFAHVKMDSVGVAQAELAIEKIHSGSTTNLSGGLLAGIEAIRGASGSSSYAVTSVLLLTDGHANVGLRTAEQLVPVMEGALAQSPDNTSVFCFGYGSDHDSGLLRQVADAGGGVYYFIKDVDSIPVAFADCLGGLASVVGQNLLLEISAAVPHVRIAEVLTKFKTETKAGEEGRRVVVKLGDLYAEEDRCVPVKLEVGATAAAPGDDARPLVHFQLRWADVLNARLSDAAAEVALARPVALAAAAAAARDARVLAQVSRVEAAAAMDGAKAKADAGDLPAARAVVTAAVVAVAERAAAASASADDAESVELTKQLLGDLKEVQDGLVSRERFRATGMTHEMASKSQMHYMQRSNVCHAFGSGGSMLTMKSNVYRKRSKMSMVSKGLAMASASRAKKVKGGPAKAPASAPAVPRKQGSFSGKLMAKLGL